MATPSLAGQAPGRLDMKVTSGDDLTLVVEMFDVDDLPVDVTGWTFAAQVRANYNGVLLVNLTAETAADDPLLDDHEVRVTGSAGQMADVGEGTWPWDLRRVAGGSSVRTVLAGSLLVRPNVTEV